jgi:hypothetical protein
MMTKTKIEPGDYEIKANGRTFRVKAMGHVSKRTGTSAVGYTKGWQISEIDEDGTPRPPGGMFGEADTLREAEERIKDTR